MSLTAGACARMRTPGFDCGESVVLKAADVKPLGATGKYTASLTDGADSLDAILSTDASKLVEAGTLASGATLRLTDYTASALSDGFKVIVTGCEVVAADAAPPPVKAQPATTPAPPGRAATAASTPAAAGAGPTPPTALKTGTPGGRRPTVPLAALTPYATSWTVRACVVSRAPKRTTPAGHAVFSAELVDEAGDAIDATFWREAADRWDPVIADGAWFYFSKAKVKPANKAYSSVRNPYALDFGVGSTVEACPPAAAGAPGSAPPARPAAKLAYVRFDALAPHIGRKAPVDVLGAVLEVGPLGSVKRKADASELARRDVTLGDASGKSVVLTLWGEAAEGAGGAVEAAAGAAAAAGSPPPLLSVSHCRVSDFNGVSISALGRSCVCLNPTGAAPDTLKAWWAAEAPGAGGAGFTPAGEGLAKAGGGAGGPRPRARLAELEAAPGEALPPPSAKPEYHTVVATVTLVDPEQTMWYAAAPVDHNRKVTARDGGWWCEYDQTLHPSMTRRYVAQLKAADETGEATVALFDEAARGLLGASADELAALRDGSGTDGGKAYEGAVKASQFSTWVMRVQTRTQEYNGELRRRLAVHSLSPMDWGVEARRLVGLIDGVGA